MAVSNILRAPTEVKYAEFDIKQASQHYVASGSICFTSIFASNCVINVSMAAPEPEGTKECEITEKRVCAQMEIDKQ